MKKLLDNFWFKVLLGPVMGISGIWMGSNIANGNDATVPLLLLLVGLFLSLVNFVYRNIK